MKKTISLLLIMSLLLSGMTAFAALDNFSIVAMYYDGLFTDVSSSAWYAPNVKTAYMYDLVKGGANNKFDPTGNMTVAQAITLAARIHSIYHTGSANFTQGSPWYQVYVTYALQNGIIYSGQFDNYNSPAKRTDFASIMAKSLPDYEFNAINSIAYGTIPDVIGTEIYADDVYMLYDAGILTGSDKYSSFKPNTYIQRAEVATIATRIIDKSARVTFSIVPKPADPTGLALYPAKTTLNVGESSQWSASVYPADSNPTIKWASSNNNVATVDATGKVTAKSAGTAKITATTENGITEVCTVTVNAMTPTGLTLAGNTGIYTGETTKWTATVTPSGANQWVYWTSGNTAVATVDQNGNITGINVGESNITATTANGISKTVKIYVYSPKADSYYSEYYPGYWGYPDLGTALGISPIYTNSSGNGFAYAAADINRYHRNDWGDIVVDTLESYGFYYEDSTYNSETGDEIDIFMNYNGDIIGISVSYLPGYGDCLLILLQ